MKVKTLAVPIRAVDYSETSQILSLYTREQGLLEGIAKGSYRERGSFDGPFDIGVLYEVVFVERRSGGLSVLTESSVVEGYGGVRRRWDRYVAACHLLEFLRTIAVAGSSDAQVFDLACDSLAQVSLSGGERIGVCLARFDARALRLLGLLAPVRSCVICGRDWPGGERPALLSPRAGGLVCSRCRGGSYAAGTSLPGRAIRLLDRLTEPLCPWEEIEVSWPVFGRPLAKVVSELRNHLLEREFRAVKVCGLSPGDRAGGRSPRGGPDAGFPVAGETRAEYKATLE